MSEEQLRILRLIEEGRISAEEGIRMMEALRRRTERPVIGTRSRPGRRLRVRVFHGDDANPAAELALPLALAESLLDLLRPHLGAALERHGIAADEIVELLDGLKTAGPMEIARVRRGDTRVEVRVE